MISNEHRPGAPLSACQPPGPGKPLIEWQSSEPTFSLGTPPVFTLAPDGTAIVHIGRELHKTAVRRIEVRGPDGELMASLGAQV